MERPRIGVTRWEDVPGEAVDRYWDRLREAGAEIVDIDEACAARVDEIAAQIDALVLTGGIDIDPSIYGASERHPRVKETSVERDRAELAYLDRALKRDVPVLAICRGHQLLNVAFGGSLLQHIDSGEHRADYRTEGYPSRWHDVRVLPDSRLAAALGTTSAEMNSRHHQAVLPDGLGSALRPVAFADDDTLPAGRELIEGMESEQHRWVVSVQWHPERLEPQRPHFAPLMRRLYAAFVEEVRRVTA